MLEREDLRQVRSVVKDVLREGHLDKLPDLFGREHHKHRGTHDLTFQQLVDAPDYIDNRQFITIVNEDEDGVAFIDLLGTDHQIVVTKNPLDFTLSLHHQVHIYSDEEAPRVRVTNLSETLELDPVFQYGLGPLDSVQFTHGVDDSDSDKWKISNLSALGTLAVAQGAFSDRLVFFHEADENLCYVDLADFTTDGVIFNGTAGSGDGQFSGPRSITYDGVYLYVSDILNNRVQKFEAAGGTFVAKVNIRRPWGICHWEGYVYVVTNTAILIGSWKYHIYKINADTMAIEATYEFDSGSGNDQFNGPRGMATDGTNLYICDTANSRVKKTSMAGTYVAKVGSSGSGNGQFGGSSPVDCEVDGNYLYVCDYGNQRIQIFDKSTLAYVAQGDTQVVDGTKGSPSSIAINDAYYYVNCNHAVPKNGYIEKYDIATRSYQATYDTVVLLEREDVGWSAEIAKFVSSGTRYGDLFVIHQDGSYIDHWPICRFMDDIRLVEDGDLATGDYVGLRAPGTVTASYSLTFPAALPAGQSHLSCSSGGVLSFGQDVNTTASPTFVRLTLTQAIGTAPMTITSTTVVTNLNADLVDGKHEAAFVLVGGTRPLTASWDVGSFEVRAQTFQSDVATGTAPFTVASTTAVTNLNADLLDGSHAAAFAAAGHNHSGVYEPVLGNPGTDGWILSSTILGVRSWVAPGGGGGAFLDLSDVPASYATHGGKFVKVNAAENALEFIASSVAGHTLASASHTDVDATGLSDDDILRYDSASGQWKCEALPAASNHDLLSATHSDTTASAVSRGSLIYGNATPKWAELNVGLAGQVLTADGTDVKWMDPGEERSALMATYISVSTTIDMGAATTWAGTSIGYVQELGSTWREYRTAVTAHASSSIAYTGTNLFCAHSCPVYELRYQVGVGATYNSIANLHCHVGFFSATQAEQAALSGEGAAFNFSPGASANWVCRSMDATIEQTTDSGVAVAAGTAYDLVIRFISATEIRFYIDRVLVATHTTRYPAATTGLLVSHKMWTTEAVSKSHGVCRVKVNSN